MAGALAVGGGYCLHRASRINRSLLPLAAIPIVFGVQQFCEGWVWTGLARGDPTVTKLAALSFLFFALLFWPVWIPYSMFLAERARRTKVFLLAMTALGVVIGLGLMVPIVVDPAWLTVVVAKHSLDYNIARSPIFHALPEWLWESLYVFVVSTPLFVSSVQKMVHCGVAVILAAVVTQVFFPRTFASVWCFFAAALSLYLCAFFATTKARSVSVARH